MDNLKLKTNQYTINVPEKMHSLAILEGKALDPKAPVPIRIEGDISSPANFFAIRKAKLNLDKCHLLVSRDCLTLIINEDDPYLNGYVKGYLKLDNECSRFGINTLERSYDSQSLSNLFRRNKHLFYLENEWMECVNSLRQFESHISVNLKNTKETNGDMEKAIKITLNNNVPQKFMLNTRVYGRERIPYDVEIGAEFRGANSVNFYLDSSDLDLIIAESSDKLIEENLKIFKDNGIAIIYT